MADKAYPPVTGGMPGKPVPTKAIKGKPMRKKPNKSKGR